MSEDCSNLSSVDTKKLLIHVWTVIEKLTGHTDLKNQTLLMHGHSYLDKDYTYIYTVMHGYLDKCIRFIFEISIFESEYARPVPDDNVHSLGFPPFIHSFTQIVVNISNGAKVIYQVKYF